jgi:hypothetical protein
VALLQWCWCLRRSIPTCVNIFSWLTSTATLRCQHRNARQDWLLVDEIGLRPNIQFITTLRCGRFV